MVLAKTRREEAHTRFFCKSVASQETSYISHGGRFTASTNPRPGVEGDVGPHEWLDAPNQFLESCTFQASTDFAAVRLKVKSWYENQP